MRRKMRASRHSKLRIQAPMQVCRRALPKLRAAGPLIFLMVAWLSGCGWFNNSGSSNNGGPAGTISFSTMVVIGDSLSAGFQNGSLLDSQQPNGWASLVATQAGANLPLPLIASPGVPAVLQLVSVGPPPVIQQASGVSSGRDDESVQPYDIAVPGHRLNDLINAAPTIAPSTSEDIITDLILGFPLGNDNSQMNEAIALNPTALFVWIGNDDALVADTSGSPSQMTDVTAFTQEFTQLLSTLQSKTHAHLIVANLPDVTEIPYLTPAATVISETAAQTGQSEQQVATELGIQDGDLVNATGLAQVQSAIDAIKQGQTPGALTDSGFLDATEIAQVQSTIASYNAAIASEVSAVGGTLVDMHSFIANLAQNGATVNGYHATTAFLGGLFGLDGEHPTNTGYALLANEYIDTMNASLGTKLADVNVSAIAANDPLFGPNIKPTGGIAPRIPIAAAKTLDALVGR